MKMIPPEIQKLINPDKYAEESQETISKRIEDVQKAAEVRARICEPHCMFSRTCKKKPADVTICSTVIKHTDQSMQYDQSPERDMPEYDPVELFEMHHDGHSPDEEMT